MSFNLIPTSNNILLLNWVVVSSHSDRWCKLSYPGHPEGCPNFGKKLVCPPTISIYKFFDFTKPLYFIYSEFNLEEHMNKMAEAHPKWTDRQKRCCLYWQGSNRKQLQKEVKKFCGTFSTKMLVTYVPEAMGVNVYATCFIHGLKLEKIRQLKVCRHIAMVGCPRNGGV